MKRFITRLWDRIEQRGLAQRAFTAVLPLAPGTATDDQRLRELLRAIDQKPPYDLVPGLHSLRWVLFDDLQPRVEAVPVLRAPATGPLVLELLHDGDVEDLLYELLAGAREGIDPVLVHCHDYPGSSSTIPMDERVRYILKYRRASSYLFRDRRRSFSRDPQPGPRSVLDRLRADTHGARMVSRQEIRRAVDLRQRFVQLVIDTQPTSDAQLRNRLEELCAEQGVSYPLPLARPFEAPQEHDGEWMRRTAELARNKVRRDTRERGDLARRPVHGKHHGLLRATFQVRDDVPASLQRGIFVPGASYEAWVRLSNANAVVQHDHAFDGRGLAIKVVDVAACGDGILGSPLPDELPDGKTSLTQDFTLVSHPTFFIRNARDYAIFRSIVDSRLSSKVQALPLAKPELFLKAATFGLRRPRELAIFTRTLLRRINHPLRIDYHSTLAFLHGEGLAVKYAVYPIDAKGHRLRDTTRANKASPNYLREALQRSLDPTTGRPQYLEFAVYRPRPGVLLPVEDPTVAWNDKVAECVPLARVEIPPQDFTSNERVSLAEHMIFTPWHALEAHKPLGSLNRARLLTYVAAAEERSLLNGVQSQRFQTTIRPRSPVTPVPPSADKVAP